MRCAPSARAPAKHKHLNTWGGKGKVPVLNHGSFALTESSLSYLNEVFADNSKVFVPDNARERAQLSEWCFA